MRSARDDRHLVAATRSSSARREWGADVDRQPRDDDVAAAVKEATVGGADVVVETRRRGDLEDSLAAVDARRTGRRLRRDERPEPAGAAAPLLVEAADLYGSTMGTREDFLGAYDLVAGGTRAGPTSTRCSRSRRPAPRTSAWRRGEQFGKIVLSIPG